MAPDTGTTFAASTEQPMVHNHSFGYVHQARRAEATSTALAKDYGLFVPSKPTLQTASDTYTGAQPTGVPAHPSFPTLVKENFMVRTMAAVAVSLAIIAGLLVLITTGVLWKRAISKWRRRHHRQVRKGNGKGRADSADLMEEGVFGTKGPDSPALPLQNSPSFVVSHDIDLERGVRGPAQRTAGASWFAQIFQSARTGFHHKDTQSPKEESSFLGRKPASLPQQKTWPNFSLPESSSYPMPHLYRMPQERKGACESYPNSQVALASGLSLHHSLDCIASAPSVHRTSQARPIASLRTSQGLEVGAIAEKPSKGGQKDVQEVSVLASVSTESFVGPFAEEKWCSAMIDTGSELVPTVTASLQTVGTSATARHENENFEHQENLTRTERMDKAILASLDLKRAGEGGDEPKPSTP